MIFSHQSHNPNEAYYFRQYHNDLKKYTLPIINQYQINNQHTTQSSIDTIIQKDHFGSDIAGTIMKDKIYTFRSNIKLFKNLIENRTQIKKEHLSHLDYKIGECRNYLVNLEGWPIFGNPMVESKRAGLGQAITRLESEKNIEQSRCWSDQSRLYQELQALVTDYQTLIRKNKFINGEHT